MSNQQFREREDEKKISEQSRQVCNPPSSNGFVQHAGHGFEIGPRYAKRSVSMPFQTRVTFRAGMPSSLRHSSAASSDTAITRSMSLLAIANLKRFQPD